MKNRFVIGSRGSQLALTQANWVMDVLCEKYPSVKFEIEVIKTEGDKGNIGVVGAFVKEIQQALLEGKVDIAVHSMKDLPVELNESLKIAAVTKREDVRDVLISKNNSTLTELAQGAVIGTGSPRREIQLKMLRPDIEVRFIKGNVDTRIRKVREEDYDAIVLANAGIKRLGLEQEVAEYFDEGDMLPAVGQGALGIEIRSRDLETNQVVQTLNHDVSRISILAERVILEKLGGGCNKPLAAYAKIEGDLIILDALYSDNGHTIQTTEEGLIEDYQVLAEKVAENLLENVYLR